MTQVDFPYHFDRMGHTGSPESDDAHIRDLIEQVLFTAPGERVNRPDFGSGLMQLVFQPNSPELAAATEFLVQSSLQQWLGEVILVETVTVDADDSALRVSVQYVVRRTATRATAEFTGGGVP